MPSGVAVYDDRIFLSFPRWGGGDYTVAELVDGAPVPYPSLEANTLEAGVEGIHSVNGIHVDSRGRLWILDNARIDLRPGLEGAPKLVVWDTVAEEESFRHYFGEEIAPAASSFLNDIALDEPHGHAYISESGMGGTPCLIAFDIARDEARRVLDGHHSVVADAELDLRIDDAVVMLHRPDGPVPWRVAVNSIALTPDAQTVVFGPMSSGLVFEVPTAGLRDEDMSAEDLAGMVTDAGVKPQSDGMAIDAHGTRYYTDVENAAVLVSAPDDMVTLAQDERMSFPVAIEVAGDGWVYFTSNQLHRMPAFHGGEDLRQPPYYLWRVWWPESRVGE